MSGQARERQQSLAAGRSITLRLESLAPGGEAVGRHQGQAVFVAYGAPGDVAQVRITRAASNFARGVIEALIEDGPDRVPPPCPYFGACGGCQWQHLDYSAQVRAKSDILRQAFERIGGTRVESIEPPLPMAHPFEPAEPTPWRYRGIAEYSVARPANASGAPALGFLRRHGDEVIPVADCLVQHPLNIAVLRATNDWLARNDAASLWLVRTRASFAEAQALVTLVFAGEETAARPLAEHLLRTVPGIAGISVTIARDRREQHRRLSRHIAGEQFVREQVGDRSYRIGLDSFFQVNPGQAERLVEVVGEMTRVGATETVVDAYCGAGVILLALAHKAAQAIGIESNPAAVRDARANLRRAGLVNAQVVHEKVERALPMMARQAAGPRSTRQRRAPVARGSAGVADVIILDPPRQGCGREVMGAVAALSPRAVAMVSCDPATLARDVALLVARGYAARRAVAVDMFPHSWRVESVTLCERA
jgi:23S rRNA (uracil1939-C5)-methyltransferase